MRFHLDEHVDHAVAHGLRQRGIDVSTTGDADLLEAPDEEHIAYALRDRRIVYTNDADFLRLHNEGVEHAGIAYCPRGTRTIAQIVRHLCLMHDCMTEEEMHGIVEYL